MTSTPVPPLLLESDAEVVMFHSVREAEESLTAWGTAESWTAYDSEGRLLTILVDGPIPPRTFWGTRTEAMPGVHILVTDTELQDPSELRASLLGDLRLRLPHGEWSDLEAQPLSVVMQRALPFYDLNAHAPTKTTKLVGWSFLIALTGFLVLASWLIGSVCHVAA